MMANNKRHETIARQRAEIIRQMKRDGIPINRSTVSNTLNVSENTVYYIFTTFKRYGLSVPPCERQPMGRFRDDIEIGEYDRPSAVYPEGLQIFNKRRYDGPGPKPFIAMVR